MLVSEASERHRERRVRSSPVCRVQRRREGVRRRGPLPETVPAQRDLRCGLSLALLSPCIRVPSAMIRYPFPPSVACPFASRDRLQVSPLYPRGLPRSALCAVRRPLFPLLCSFAAPLLCWRDAHRIPLSLSAFCRIVSLTAAKTRRIFEVSVACVKCGKMLSRARFVCVKRQRIYLAALLTSAPPEYSGKKSESGIRGIFCLKTSILFRKRMMDVRRNQPV